MVGISFNLQVVVFILVDDHTASYSAIRAGGFIASDRFIHGNLILYLRENTYKTLQAKFYQV